MPLEGPELLILLLALALGGGVFLRLVAREKRRREQYLKYRLWEEVEKLKKQQLTQADPNGDQASKTGDAPVATAEVLE
jgi:hypothetical protein